MENKKNWIPIKWEANNANIIRSKRQSNLPAVSQQPEIYNLNCLLFILTCFLYSVVSASYKVRGKEYDYTFIGTRKKGVV